MKLTGCSWTAGGFRARRPALRNAVTDHGCLTGSLGSGLDAGADRRLSKYRTRSARKRPAHGTSPPVSRVVSVRLFVIYVFTHYTVTQLRRHTTTIYYSYYDYRTTDAGRGIIKIKINIKIALGRGCGTYHE